MSIVHGPRGMESAKDQSGLSRSMRNRRRRIFFPVAHARGDGSPWRGQVKFDSTLWLGLCVRGLWVGIRFLRRYLGIRRVGVRAIGQMNRGFEALRLHLLAISHPVATTQICDATT
jgi:hypothetical protein